MGRCCASIRSRRFWARTATHQRQARARRRGQRVHAHARVGSATDRRGGARGALHAPGRPSARSSSCSACIGATPVDRDAARPAPNEHDVRSGGCTGHGIGRSTPSGRRPSDSSRRYRTPIGSFATARRTRRDRRGHPTGSAGWTAPRWRRPECRLTPTSTSAGQAGSCAAWERHWRRAASCRTGSTRRASAPAEAFHPGLVEGGPRPPHPPEGPSATGSVVLFGRSDLRVAWDDRYGSLLELAEACDVPVSFSCRTGVCGSCESGVLSGSVEYTTEPLDPPPEGRALLCCSRPVSELTLEL